MAAKVGIIGSGQVAQVLANGFLKYGYEVMAGSRDVTKLADWKSKAPKVQTGTFEQAASFGEIIVLAAKGTAAESITKSLSTLLANKIVIDTTNPIAEAPPVNGVLQFFTSLSDSLMERLQKLAPSAKFVKAFNCVGNNFMVDPAFPAGKPTMFICGNDASAKKEVSSILKKFGWEIADMGAMEAARAIEPLCMLWCIPGFIRNEWQHAFKLVKI